MRSAFSIALVGLLVVASAPAAAAATAPAAPTESVYDAPATEDAPVSTPDDASASDAGAGVSNHDACGPLAGDPPEDPESDRLGWESGCWYNESLSVTREDGLNETELDAVVARSAARVEAVRELEFEESVPVEVISREELRERRETNDSENATSTANRLHQNVKWEAMFSIGENEDAITTRRSSRTATIGGFYNYNEDRIVIVSENTTQPKMDEITLSQELFHALQDQKLRVSYNRSTEEGNNAALGIIEGDGNLVDRRYQQRCESEWNCLLPEASESGGGGSDDINYGVYLTGYQPYSDGPKFVRNTYNEGGWEAVDAVYENPPTSTEQVIHPAKYSDEEPAEISFEDASSEAWRIPDLGNGSVDYATFGQGGLAAMMMRPVFATGGTATPVVGPRDFYNLTDSGEISQFDPLNYGFDAVDGWGNDRLYPYVTDDSVETNETGYVWKTVWDDGANASEFRDAYVRLIRHYGAEEVAERPNTYRIPDDSEFGDAFYVEQDGDTVVIVNAPTVEDLGDVREGAGQVEESTETPSPTDATDMPTPTDEPTPTDTPAVDPGATPTETATSEEVTAANGPGFGGLAVVAAVALALASLGVAARRRTGR
jgi:hypothetical protein